MPVILTGSLRFGMAATPGSCSLIAGAKLVAAAPRLPLGCLQPGRHNRHSLPAVPPTAGAAIRHADIFEAGLRVNTVVYLDVKETVVKPWMDSIAAGRPYIFQQDGAPAHNSNRTQQWCEANLPFFWEKEVWPPSSPDCNPLDYFVWGVAERDVNRSSHNTKQSLVNTIMEVFANIPREDIIRACSRFRSRLEEVVAAGGDFIR